VVSEVVVVSSKIRQVWYKLMTIYDYLSEWFNEMLYIYNIDSYSSKQPTSPIIIVLPRL